MTKICTRVAAPDNSSASNGPNKTHRTMRNLGMPTDPLDPLRKTPVRYCCILLYVFDREPHAKLELAAVDSLSGVQRPIKTPMSTRCAFAKISPAPSETIPLPPGWDAARPPLRHFPMTFRRLWSHCSSSQDHVRHGTRPHVAVTVGQTCPVRSTGRSSHSWRCRLMALPPSDGKPVFPRQSDQCRTESDDFEVRCRGVMLSLSPVYSGPAE